MTNDFVFYFLLLASMIEYSEFIETNVIKEIMSVKLLRNYVFRLITAINLSKIISFPFKCTNSINRNILLTKLDAFFQSNYLDANKIAGHLSYN